LQFGVGVGSAINVSNDIVVSVGFLVFDSQVLSDDVDQFFLHAQGGLENLQLVVASGFGNFFFNLENVFVFEDFEKLQKDSFDFIGDVIFENGGLIGYSESGVQVVEIEGNVLEVESLFLVLFENFVGFEEFGNVLQNGPNGGGRVFQSGNFGEEDFLNVEILDGVFNENNLQISLNQFLSENADFSVGFLLDLSPNGVVVGVDFDVFEDFSQFLGIV